MADSDNESELSEISLNQFRVLEDYYEANYQEPTEDPKLEDELDDEGFSTAEIDVESRQQEQDRRGGHSIFLRQSGFASQETASEVYSQNDRKRKQSQTHDHYPTKRLRVPSENFTVQDRQRGGSLGVSLEFEVMETPEQHSATLIRPTGIQSVAQDMPKSHLTTAQPSAVNASSSHDLEHMAYCNHVDPISNSSMTKHKSAEPPPRRTLEDSSQESGDMQFNHNGIHITSNNVDHSKETPQNNELVEGSTKVHGISDDIEQTLKRTKGRSKRPPKHTAVKKSTSRRTDRLWEVDTVVIDPNSPLGNLNLHAVLMNEKAWTSLSLEQQKKLISMLPNGPPIDTTEGKECLPNIPKAVLQRSAAMKADVRLFQEDLRAGRLEPEWQLMARRAMSRRANGDFDEFEKKRREEIWGISKGDIEFDGQQSEQNRIKGKKESKTG